MAEELQALGDNHTWDVVQCPLNVKSIDCKWIYLIKLRSNGTLDFYNALLVVLVTNKSMGSTLRRILLLFPK